MDMQAIIREALSAANAAAQPYHHPGRREDFAIATVRFGPGQVKHFSGPERFAETQAMTFAEVLRKHGIKASWTSRVD